MRALIPSIIMALGVAMAAPVAAMPAQAATPGAARTPLVLAPDPAALFPEAPEKAVILAQCGMCHGLDWVTRHGGSQKGWEDRLTRMIRAGAMITRDQIPQLAAYLAKAFPERPPPARSE